MNAILHSPEYQKTRERVAGPALPQFQFRDRRELKIRVLNVGKEELYRNLKNLSRGALGSEPAVQGGL